MKKIEQSKKLKGMKKLYQDEFEYAEDDDETAPMNEENKMSEE